VKEIKKLFVEFKEFISRGNVMGLAIGVMIASAFQGVIVSLTDNLLSPIIGLFASRNFDSLELNVLGITLRYGAFVTSVINFIIMAFVVFLLARVMNTLLSRGKKDDAPAAPERLCPYCKTALHAEATRCPACTSQLG
jgi:large conductance mechanosensitive channel